jgi:GT2 family glycosyltransferase
LTNTSTLSDSGEQTRQLRASVIIPVRDGAPLLRELIPLLEQQTVPRSDFEVIVADDGSTDDPLKGFALGQWLRISPGPPLTEFAARNRAAGVARGRVLAFIDADCRPEPDWLENGLRAAENAEVVAGALRFTLPARPNIWTMLNIDVSKNQERRVRQGNAETANLFVTRELFERVEGFDPTFSYYADFDFARRSISAGGRLVYADDALAWHPTRDRPMWLLTMVWRGNRWYAAHTTRAGSKPNALKLREWVPVVQTFRGRRRSGQSAGLDRAWFEKNGLKPSLWDNVRAVPMIYIVMPYLGLVGQVVGWRDGRRLHDTTATTASPHEIAGESAAAQRLRS